MPSLPLVTVGMTCYNAADTIGRAIDGALAQDWPNLEILIVDDASGDQSVDVICEKISDYPHVRLVVHENNTGFAGALNTLIREAKGKYMAIFDDDDVSDMSRVRKQYERLTSYQAKTGVDLVLCHCARLQNFPDGEKFYEQTLGTVAGREPYGEAIADRILFGKLDRRFDLVGSCANCARFASLDTFRAVEGYDQTLRRSEDTEFNIRLGRAGGHLIGMAEPLVTQTMTTGSDKTLDIEYQTDLAMIHKHADYLQEKGWYAFCVAWLDLKYADLKGEKTSLYGGLFGLFLRYPVKVIKKIIWTRAAAKTRARLKSWRHHHD